MNKREMAEPRLRTVILYIGVCVAGVAIATKEVLYTGPTIGGPGFPQKSPQQPWERFERWLLLAVFVLFLLATCWKALRIRSRRRHERADRGSGVDQQKAERGGG